MAIRQIVLHIKANTCEMEEWTISMLKYCYALFFRAVQCFRALCSVYLVYAVRTNRTPMEQIEHLFYIDGMELDQFHSGADVLTITIQFKT